MSNKFYFITSDHKQMRIFRRGEPGVIRGCKPGETVFHGERVTHVDAAGPRWTQIKKIKHPELGSYSREDDDGWELVVGGTEKWVGTSPVVHSVSGSVKAATEMRQGGESHAPRRRRRRRAGGATGINREGGGEGTGRKTGGEGGGGTKRLRRRSVSLSHGPPTLRTEYRAAY